MRPMHPGELLTVNGGNGKEFSTFQWRDHWEKGLRAIEGGVTEGNIIIEYCNNT